MTRIARAAMILAARSSSPRPSPQPSGRHRTGPYMGSDYDRTRVLEVIPNSKAQSFPAAEIFRLIVSNEHNYDISVL